LLIGKLQKVAKTGSGKAKKAIKIVEKAPELGKQVSSGQKTIAEAAQELAAKEVQELAMQTAQRIAAAVLAGEDVPAGQQPPPTKPAKAADKLLSSRFKKAAEKAIGANNRMNTAVEDLASALDELNDIRDEYHEWFQFLPDSERNSALWLQLENICGIDIYEDMDDFTEALDKRVEGVQACYDVELPDDSLNVGVR
jgi:hypothetical protein